MTRCAVFLGPTLAHDAAREVLEATYLPPARQGDVLRAARAAPRAIGLIDGYFDSVLSVWHKEILWAMSRGIPVLGAASMGALRAAELADLGMVGVGEVFARFRDGRLEGDDEVAVAHAHSDRGFEPLSEALVDIRVTLEHAVAAAVIDAATASRLIELAKGLYFADRDYRRIIRPARDDGVSPRELDALEAWLPSGRLSQKQSDAIDLLASLAQLDEAGATAPPPFIGTDHWSIAEQAASRTATVVDSPSERLAGLAELRLDPIAYDAARHAALCRAALTGGPLREPSAEETTAAIRRRWMRIGVDTGRAAREWRREQGLDGERLRAFARHLASLDALAYADRNAFDELMIEHVKCAGDFGRLRRRAIDKQTMLRAYGLRDLTPADFDLPIDVVVGDYFATFGRRPPRDLDGYAQALDCTDHDQLIELILRERCYRRCTDLQGAE